MLENMDHGHGHACAPCLRPATRDFAQALNRVPRFAGYRAGRRSASARRHDHDLGQSSGLTSLDDFTYDPLTPSTERNDYE
jgi:hypothetical protein